MHILLVTLEIKRKQSFGRLSIFVNIVTSRVNTHQCHLNKNIKNSLLNVWLNFVLLQHRR